MGKKGLFRRRMLLCWVAWMEDPPGQDAHNGPTDDGDEAPFQELSENEILKLAPVFDPEVPIFIPEDIEVFQIG